jgi:plasmid stability protein
MGFLAKGKTDMGTIDVRNLDDDVIARLKERARDNHRSLEAEVRALLTEVSGRPSKKKFIELANPISAMTPKGVEQTDSALLIREDSDR